MKKIILLLSVLFLTLLLISCEKKYEDIDGISVNVESSKVTVQWTVTAGEYCPVYIDVYKRISEEGTFSYTPCEGFPAAVPEGEKSYVISNLENFNWYKIIVYNKAGDKMISYQSTLVYPQTSLKKKITGITESEVHKDTLYLKWTLSDGADSYIYLKLEEKYTDEEGNEKYKEDRIIGGTPEENDGSEEFKDITEYTITGLKNETSYRLTIYINNDIGRLYSSFTCTFETYDTDVEIAADKLEEGVHWVEIGARQNNILFTGVKDKTLILASINESEEESGLKVPVRYIRNHKTVSVEQQASESSGSVYAGKNENIVKHYTDPFLYKEDEYENITESENVRSAEKNNFDIKNPVPGESYRYIYLDNSDNLNTFEKRKVVLRGIGREQNRSDGDIVCFVWVEDNCFGTESTGITVNQNIVDKLTEKFAGIYNLERNIFGKEGDFNDPAKPSETGNIVNIVIYDISGDFYSDSNVTYVGYFSSKDYIRNHGYGNWGKYFYIDAPFCNFDGRKEKGQKFTGFRKDENSSYTVSDAVVSTLVHEFQHMINYNQKYLNSGKKVYSSSWYNEMLSMLAEDLFQEVLDVIDDEAPKGSRLPEFNRSYYEVGLEQFENGQDTLKYYAKSYALGAWMVRNFGGPEFLKKMSQSIDTDWNSILGAIKDEKGIDYTRQNLLNDFVKACVFRSPYAGENNITTFNRDSESITVNHNGADITLKFSAINLYDEKYSFCLSDSDNDDSTVIYGPQIFSSDYKGINNLFVKPLGFILGGKIECSEDTELVKLSAGNSGNSTNSSKTIVFIQDKYDN